MTPLHMTHRPEGSIFGRSFKDKEKWTRNDLEKFNMRQWPPEMTIFGGPEYKVGVILGGGWGNGLCSQLFSTRSKSAQWKKLASKVFMCYSSEPLHFALGMFSLRTLRDPPPPRLHSPATPFEPVSQESFAMKIYFFNQSCNTIQAEIRPELASQSFFRSTPSKSSLYFILLGTSFSPRNCVSK